MRRYSAVVIIAVAVLWPQSLLAMTIEQFDRMAVEDQRHYLTFLVREAQKLLRETAQPELAQQIDRLFREIPPGEQRSIVELQFQKSLADARGANIRFTLWHAPTSEVEFVLYDALLELGMKPGPAFGSRFGEVTRNRAFYQKELTKQ